MDKAEAVQQLSEKVEQLTKNDAKNTAASAKNAEAVQQLNTKVEQFSIELEQLRMELEQSTKNAAHNAGALDNNAGAADNNAGAAGNVEGSRSWKQLGMLFAKSATVIVGELAAVVFLCWGVKLCVNRFVSTNSLETWKKLFQGKIAFLLLVVIPGLVYLADKAAFFPWIGDVSYVKSMKRWLNIVKTFRWGDNATSLISNLCLWAVVTVLGGFFW